MVLGLFTLSALTACNLAGDVTPPPGVSEPSASSAGSPVGAALTPPATRPDPSAGEPIYAARCAPCHGEGGQGDGPQAEDLPVEVPRLADPALAAAATPREWYEVVTQGRMDRFMPPFNSLTPKQRWDAVGFALSLSAPGGQESAALFDEQCADCHGDAGRGEQSGPSLVEPVDFSLRSRAAIETAIREGVGQEMPAFGEELADQEIQRLAAYVQALGFESEAEPSNVAGSERGGARSAETGGVVAGRVVNGATGEPIQEELSVTLHAFDGQEQVLTDDADVGPGGTFSFPDVEMVSGRLYVVSADYQGVRYVSDVGRYSETEGPLDLSLTVYESTPDPSDVLARRVHVLVDRPTEASVRLVELWVFVNQGDRSVEPANGEGGLEVALPEAASNIRFEDSPLAERYQPTELGFRLTTPLRPGGEGAQVVFSFDLPLRGGVELIQPMTVPVEAVTVLVVDGGPRVEGSRVQSVGAREAAGERFHQYELGPLAAGETLRLRLEGPSFWRRILPRSLESSWAVGAAALAFALAAVVWWYRPWIAAEQDESIDETGQRLERRRRSLLQAIADLDDSFERGEVEEAAYRHRRGELKAALMRLIEAAND